MALPRLIEEDLSQWRNSPASLSDKDKYYWAKQRSIKLLHQVLPVKTWKGFEKEGVIRLTGLRGKYAMSPYEQTEIRDLVSGKHVANACLQLSIPAPTYDRVVAEYLILLNAEDFYWKTANVISVAYNEIDHKELAALAFDIILFVNLLLNLLLGF